MIQKHMCRFYREKPLRISIYTKIRDAKDTAFVAEKIKMYFKGNGCSLGLKTFFKMPTNLLKKNSVEYSNMYFLYINSFFF